MSISTLESAGSRRALSAMDVESAARERAMASLVNECKGAFARGDASAVATFAGTCTDWSNRLPGGGYGKRMQKVADVMSETVEGHKFEQRAMQILLSAAAGRGCQREAQQLLDELAAKWADDNVDNYL